jgi:poly-beta-1,6-N-acetyl-D-glucosamine synthase
VRTLAGVYQLIGQYPQLLGPKNRMWIHFMSHKVGRLLLPYLLIASYVSSFYLPAPWNLVLATGQLVFYGVAMLDQWVPPSRIKKYSSLAWTFVVLMWAALCATSIIFRPSQSLWKTAR